MAHLRPKGNARVGALSLIHVVPDHQRQQIKECIVSARAEGRSRTFVHAAIISTDIRVVVKHPNELEQVLGGDDMRTRETDEIITNQELSRLTLRYEEVYKNFYHVKTCLAEEEISHYVIRRDMSVGEFDIIKYEEDNSIILEKRQKGLLERIFGNDKTHVPVTALIIVADFLMPFTGDSVISSPRCPTSPHRSRSHSDFSLARSRSQKNVMYEIDLGDKRDMKPIEAGPKTDRSHFYRRRVVSMSDDDDVLASKRVLYKRNNSIRNITVTRTRSSVDLRKQ